ncbi:MAG TPA: response regulator [Anaerolineales bacterium]|nr:response regulator [Anaerolineales bacterium]
MIINPEPTGHILVVDDNKLNRMLLFRMLGDLGHRVTEAADGIEALDLLQAPETRPVDVVLLDILMPELDGYGLLEEIKQDARLRHIPVIMISALDEIDSVVRCIEIGATDYLTKPVQPSLLKARLKASLAEKRLRDLELEYLEQVGHVVSAAEAVESEKYDPESLHPVAAREDALGRLARVFQKMAREVHLREQRLKHQLSQLQLDIQEMQKALAEELQIYIPMDRRQALYHRTDLKTRTDGAVLFADISDFTPMTAMLSKEFGRPRGAEEITRLINQIFAALIEEVHAFGGSVISFGGDAITCWFDDQEIGSEPARPLFHDARLRALVCGLYMQTALLQFEYSTGWIAVDVRPSIKVAVVSGLAGRFLTGNPEIQVLEALVGRPLENLERAEHLVRRGEVLADMGTCERHLDRFTVKEFRTDPETGERYAVIENLKELVPPSPWREIPARALEHGVCRPWVHPTVYRHVLSNTGQFLSELRPAAALFFRFQGIDYENDPFAETLLDDFIRWVQQVVHEEEGAILQLTFGDKGSYLYVTFGAPVTHDDDAARAIRAGLKLLDKPERFKPIHDEQIGISYGQMRAGSYGGDARRTYGVLGNQANLAARLMQAAAPGEILCDQACRDAAAGIFEFLPLPEIRVKGREEPIRVFRPAAGLPEQHPAASEALRLLDSCSPGEQMVLKLASVIGPIFDGPLLIAILPGEAEKASLPADLRSLEQAGIIRVEAEGMFSFSRETVHAAAYQSMLHVQRRTVHRQVATAMEQIYAENLNTLFPIVAGHWQAAEETTRAIEYLEKAGALARAEGDLERARAYLERSLELSTSSSVLSEGYRKET